MAAAMLVYGAATGLVVPRSDFWPASALNQESFLAAVGVPVQLVRGGLATLMAMAIHFHYRTHAEEMAGGGWLRWCSPITLVGAMLLVLAGGWVLAEKQGRHEDQECRQALLGPACAVAATTEATTLTQLAAGPEDLTKEPYNELRQQFMRAAGSLPDCRQVYLMRLKGGQVVFAIDSLPERGPEPTDSIHVTPGQEYSDAPPALLDVFRSGEPATVGPYANRGGTWVSAFARVEDAGDVVGVDVDAASIQKEVAAERGAAIAITALVALIIIGAYTVVGRLRHDAMLLAQSHQNFAKAFEASPVSKTIASLATQRFLEVNKAFEAETGYRREEAIGRTPQEIGLSVDPADDDRMHEKLHKDGMRARLEIRCRTKNGGILIGRLSAEIIEYASEPAILVVLDDITALKRAEEELRFRNLLLTTQQEVSIDGILVVDDNGAMLSFNRRFIEMWGIPPEVTTARVDEPALRLVLDKLVDSRQFVERIEHILAQRHESSRDEIALKDGRVLDCYSAPMFAADERYYGRVWFFRDVTESRRSEQEVRRANEALAASVRQLEERGRQNTVLSDMRELLQASASVADLPSTVRSGMERLLPDVEGALYLVSPSRVDLECVCRWGEFPDEGTDNLFAPDACWALRLGHVHLVEDVRQGPLSRTSGSRRRAATSACR